MDFQRIDEEIIEILPGPCSRERVLEEIARLSYETAVAIAPSFAQPFDVPADFIHFKDFIKEGGLHLNYLNGKLCSTYVKKKGDRYFFDASSFREDRGHPEAFLALVKEQLGGCSETQHE